MKLTSIYSAALILGSAGAVTTMLFHPSGNDLLSQPDHIARHNEMITTLTHSLAIISCPILFFGFSGLSRQLGLARPLVMAALIAYGFAVLAGASAAIINGIVGPSLTRQIITSDESSRVMLRLILMNNTLLNQAFDKIFLVAGSIAIICWSIAILGRDKLSAAVGVVGCVIGAASILALAAGYLKMNVLGFGLAIGGQVVWTFLVAIMLTRLSYTDERSSYSCSCGN